MFRDLESQLLNCWLLEIGHGLDIYIVQTDKRYKIELLKNFSESWLTSTPLTILPKRVSSVLIKILNMLGQSTEPYSSIIL